MVLFAFVLTHLANHALGIFQTEAMEASRGVFMLLWGTWLGQVALYGSLLLHAGLSLTSLYRRRHLKMPSAERAQLLLGLLLPILLAEHIVSVRFAGTAMGVDASYKRLLLIYFVEEPWRAAIMAGLTAIVWFHGVLGLAYAMRTRLWPFRAQAVFVAVAALVPALAIAGVFAAGVDLARDVAEAPWLADKIWRAATPDPAAAKRFIARWEVAMVAVTLAIIVSVLLARACREWVARRMSPIELRFVGAGSVVVPKGFSVLEASRFASLPHASVCGGRGRCSTCRVRVLKAVPPLAPAAGIERDTLERLGAPSDVRLACQLRPEGRLVVEPLHRPGGALLPSIASEKLALGKEMTLAVLSVDLRRSSALATEKLPFDVLYIVDSFLRVVTKGVRAEGGVIVGVAGDGVLAAFGLDGDAVAGCKALVRALQRVEDGMDELNVDLDGELPWQLRFAAGGHVGTCIIGLPSDRFHGDIQFVSDTSNIAARLEQLAKEHDVASILSKAVVDYAAVNTSSKNRLSIELRGRDGLVEVVKFQSFREGGVSEV